ncbi:magnetosome biogenesis CDF transporter MamM [Candidatus Magnetobacterium casense]|uniref:Magnetosome biogenesis CDF transporter MamM n=1 Tax=Candidatus Magnetobacterium casense TaxID=1455061 RepID=A0ABS6RVV0_9BACT|nr:magnetosome biogenesis CDF transporter MamM [Candidatus Magnetobacterium casensis]MBV6340756.1 magnetosome biogenesis CDF transporter MamM [Candidatus Magnetobacterium casensis]
MHQLPHNKIAPDHIVCKECYKCESKATLVAVVANLLLAVFKAVIGILSGSKSILVDALYSFKDFMTSLVVYVVVIVSGKPADDNHPYGHEKIEFVAILLISILIIIGTLFLFVHSVKSVWFAFQGNIEQPRFIAFWAALISVVANYKIASYLSCVGHKRGSLAMLANAKHNHSDAVSSAMVAGAILGTHYGLYFLDPLVAVIETIDLIRLSVIMLKDALDGVMDSNVNQETIDHMEELTKLVPGVQQVTQVIGRKVGRGMWVSIIIKVKPDLNYEDGYKVGLQVEETIKKKVGNVAGINLSIEPHVV